jgi:peroxiredoxin
MAMVEEGATAPGFTLTDTRGQFVTLSNYKRDKHIVLVLNRGFV